jgi:hypothetical protein
MKKLTVLLMLVPGLAAAHGAHAPMPEAAHGLAHATPVLAGAILAVAIGLAVLQRWRA